MKLPQLLALLLLTLVAACAKAPEGGASPTKAKKTHHLVETAAVSAEARPITLERTGNLRARREVRVLNQEEGKIVEMPFFEGDRVAKGEVLVRIDDRVLRAQLRKARAQREQAQLDLTRLERLQGKRLVAEEETARARTAVDIAKAEEEELSTRLANTSEKAPFAGVVTERRAEPGDIAPRFTHLLSLIDPDSLITEITVSELVLPELAVGDTVEVRVDALGDRPFPGKILRIHPNVDPVSRQGVIEIVLQPAPKGMRPGQFCRVRLQTRPVPRRTIPFAALRRDTAGEYVFRLRPGGERVERVPVVSGLFLQDRVEIREGLTEGDRAVVKGFLGLNETIRVRETGSASGESFK